MPTAVQRFLCWSDRPSSRTAGVLIDRAVRDEGTSYHYLPPSTHSFLDPNRRDPLVRAFDRVGVVVETGTSWTTDAPFRETAGQLEHHRTKSVLLRGNGSSSVVRFRRSQRKETRLFRLCNESDGNDRRRF